MKILHLLLVTIIGAGLVRELCNDLEVEVILVYAGALVAIFWHYNYLCKKESNKQ